MRLLLSLVIMLFFVSPSVAQEFCDDANIYQEIKSETTAAETSARLAAILRQVDMGITKGFLKASQRQNAIESMLEYSIRHERKCQVPRTLRTKISDTIAITKNDAVYCPDGKFNTVIDRQHRTLKGAGGYEVFENMIKAQIQNNVISPAKENFNAKWNNDRGFRDRVIKTGLEVNVMFANNCKNLQDPILDIISEF